jgi:hypothetical protein
MPDGERGEGNEPVLFGGGGRSRASARAGLYADLDRSFADELQRALHRVALCIMVEVGPLEADDLAATHAGVRGEVQQGIEPMRLGR